MLVIALVCTVVAGLAVVRIKPSTSLESMFSKNDPTAVALFQQLHDFAWAEDLLLLVSLPEDSVHSNSTTSEKITEVSIADQQRLFDYAQRLDVVISENPQASNMVSAVVWQVGTQPRDLVEQVMVPGMLYYLDDRDFQGIQERLSADGIAKQIQRNETLIAVPSLAADVLAKQILRDPLRLYEFLAHSLESLQPPGPTQGGSGAFLSADGRSLLVRVSGSTPAADMQFTKRFMAKMRGVVAQAEPEGLVVDYAGAYAIAEISERNIRSDMIRSVVCSVVLLQLLFLIVYRHLWSFALAFVPVAVGILWGFALFTLVSTDLTPITAVVGCILAGLGIDYCIHYLSHYELRQSLDAHALPAANTSTAIGRVLLSACVTSIVAFGTICASNTQALRDFAVLGVLGLACVFISSMTVLPAIISLTDRKPAAAHAAKKTRINVLPLIVWIKNHTWLCVGFTSTIFIACLLLLIIKPGPIVRFETDMRVMHPQNNPPLDTQEKIAEQFSGVTQVVSIHLQASSSGELLRLAHQVDDRLDSPEMRQAGVLRSFGIASLLPDPRGVPLRREQIEKIDSDRVVADFRTTIEHSDFSIEAYIDYMASLKSMLRPADSPSVTTLLDYPTLTQMCLPKASFAVNGPSPKQAITTVYLEKDAMGQERRGHTIGTLRAVLNDLSNATPTSMDILSYDLQSTTRHDLATLPAIAMLVVVSWLLLMYRSVSDVILMLLPTIFSMTCLITVMWAMQINLNLINAVALPLLAGIGVDDGIFLVSLAGRRRSTPQGPTDLYDNLAASCHAIIMTSVTTALAFGSLYFTSTPAIQSLGLILGVGVVGCWVGTIFGLMPILMIRGRRSNCSQVIT